MPMRSTWPQLRLRERGFERAACLVFTPRMREAAGSSGSAWLLLLACAILACGNDDEGESNGACALPQGTESSAACEACVRASCESELAGFCASRCSPRDTSLTCQQAVATVAACALSTCANQCAAVAGAGGEGGAQSGADEPLAPGFACHVPDQGLCSAEEVKESTRATYERACIDVGGVIEETCPTEELIGCCRYAGGRQTCVYQTGASALDRDSCSQSGGRWGEPK